VLKIKKNIWQIHRNSNAIRNSGWITLREPSKYLQGKRLIKWVKIAIGIKNKWIKWIKTIKWAHDQLNVEWIKEFNQWIRGWKVEELRYQGLYSWKRYLNLAE
jgi:hypothetical protein